MKRLLWTILGWPIGLALAGWARLVLATVRLEREGDFPLETPAIYVHWHRHLPLLVPLHGRAHRFMMISSAPYMAPIARWCELLGLRLVRGTSGAGGRHALAALARVLAEGGSVVLAVDGPGGPVFQAKSGCIDLARLTGAPIVPLAYVTRRPRTVRRRWDRMLLVLPFDRVTVRTGPVLLLSDEIDALNRVESALHALDPTTVRRPPADGAGRLQPPRPAGDDRR